MFTKKIKFRDLIIFAFLAPIAFNYYNHNFGNNINCKLEINAKKLECVQQNSSALAANYKLVDQDKVGQLFGEIEKLGQEIKTPSSLQESNQVDVNRQKYNEQILELLSIVPEDDQKKICQRNWDFIASDRIEAQIQDICNKIKPKTTGKIEGINTNTKKNLFEIQKNDLTSIKK